MAKKNKYKDMHTVSLAPRGTREIGGASNKHARTTYRNIGSSSKKSDLAKPVTTSKPKKKINWRPLKIALLVVLCLALLAALAFGVKTVVQKYNANKAKETTSEVVTESVTKPGPAVEFTVDAAYIKAHDYCIAVNTSQNLVVVYTKDDNNEYTVPYKAFVCSCGTLGTGEEDNATITGAFVTESKQSWLWLNSGSFGQYATCIDSDSRLWFHSVPYFTQDPSNLEYEQYNQLGKNASNGNVYLSVGDAKWIYDNCGIGTEVILYDGADVTEPMEKPKAQTLDVSDKSTRGWDPTDPDPRNPWAPSGVTNEVNTVPTTAAPTTTTTTAAYTTAAPKTSAKASAKSTTRSAG